MSSHAPHEDRRLPAPPENHAPGQHPAQQPHRPPLTLLPPAARVLDIIAVVAALLATTVVVTGGFREWTPFGRLSLTSWLRPALVALFAAAVRAYLWPRQPLPLRVGHAILRWWHRDDTRAVLPIFLTTRVGVLIVGFLSVIVLGYGPPTGPPWRVYTNEFLNLPARFDAGWYLGIASQGYQWSSAAASGQQNIVFFPAYPLLVRYASLLVARQTMWAGVLISLGAFFVALVYIHRLARERLREDQATAAITFLAAYA
ncbi:MAG: hypothetical protein LC791_08470 [Acidobacteria bacterium]|nr:hypothetical protein [Acidobacteriota bacterium]